MFNPFRTDIWKRIKDSVTPPPLKDVLSVNGEGSFSRTSGFLVIASTLGWGWYIVLTQHHIPEPALLEAMALFMTVGAGTNYGIGQVKHMIMANKSGDAQGGEKSN